MLHNKKLTENKHIFSSFLTLHFLPSSLQHLLGAVNQNSS